ncbi:S24/S26 family peptidase [Porcipelethomonas sp.]|uniref:S24/S26 family peptidase n=1 Tax=Porcipelethomonas sp. TaxID=2981675 RepID=UPI003EFA08D7
MNKSTFEDEIQRTGRLIYTNVGDSMMPLIRQGKDLVIIEKAVGRLKKYDVPLYKRDSGQYVLHRILKVREDGYVICGDNRWQKEYGITDRNIIGVLTGIVRDGKTISVNDKKYRIYVHLWCDFFPVRAFILHAKNFLKRRLKK